MLVARLGFRCRPAVPSALLLCALLALLAPATASAADPPVQIETVTSTADGTVRVQAASLTVTPGATPGPSVQIALDAPRQRLRGVGAALTESSAVLIAGLPAGTRHELLEALFAPDQGGLSVLRIVIGASDFSLEHHSLDDSTLPDPGLTHFSIERDRQWVIPVLREILAINPTVELVASPWSAPGWMKDTGNYLFGTLQARYEPAFADYLVRFVQAYRAEGIDIGWLTLQNEPAAVQVTYPSMLMSAAQQARLITDDLGPALTAAGLHTRVLVWDHNWCDAQPPGGCVGIAPASFPTQVLSATGATWPVSGTAFHCYGGDQAAANDSVHAAWPTLEVWQTECSGGTWQGDPFVETAQRVLTDWKHWATASLLWNLALDPAHGPHLGGCGDCRGIVTVDPAIGTWEPNVDRDVLATIARFGPAGSGVLTTTTADALGITATGVCDPSGRPAAIVLNSGAARTIDVGFGDVHLPVPVAARSLTAVRAPVGVRCTLAAPSALPEPPAPHTPTVPPAPSVPTPTPPTTTTAASPAAAVPRQPTYTG